jgi:hypothetical protein
MANMPSIIAKRRREIDKLFNDFPMRAQYTFKMRITDATWASQNAALDTNTPHQ